MTPEQAYAEVQKGFEAYGQKNFQQAETIADTVLSEIPVDPNALYLKAICRRARRDFTTAMELLKQAVSVAPGVLSFEMAIGQVLADVQRFDDAIACYRKLMADFTEEVLPRLRLADLMFQLQRYDEAIEAVDAGFFLQPDNPQLHLLMAKIYDAKQDLKGMIFHSDKALSVNKDWYDAILVRAHADLLRQDYHAVIKRLNKVAPPTQFEICERSALIGDAYHQLKDYTSAYKAWLQGNDTARKYFQEVYSQQQSAVNLEGVKRAKQLFAKQTQSPLPKIEAEVEKSPLFILGFTVSGNTLIEQVLAAHPQVCGIDDRNCLSPIVQEYGRSEEAFNRFFKLTHEELSELREQYWQRVKLTGVDTDSGIFIDKSPLNLTWLGFIGRLFPHAKIILAIRDPRDTIISSFQRNFDMNPATYHMLSIAEAADYYDAAYSAAYSGIKCSPKLHVIAVKYEQLLSDFAENVTQLFNALNLPIDKQSFADSQSIAEGDSTKPSVNLVNQLLYNSSVNKWRHYAHAIYPVMETLQPWIEQHGYETEEY